MAVAEVKREESVISVGPESTADDLYRAGLVYSTGVGVDANYVQAHKFFNLAALRGSIDARQSRKELSEYMSSEEIAEAQKAAREWLKLAN